MTAPPPSRPSVQSERVRYMHTLGEIARKTGVRVLEMKQDDIANTLLVGGHQFSTVDDMAKLVMRQLINSELGLPVTVVLEESDIPRGGTIDTAASFVIVCDAVEGSTNAKRGLATPFTRYGTRPIQAGTAIMLLESTQLGSIAAAAFYDWVSKRLITSFRGEHGSFISFVDGQLIQPSTLAYTIHDSQLFAIVPGYSHSNIAARLEVEQVLLQKNFSTMGGTRSSAQDLLELLWGQADAYVDLRQRFPGKTDNQDEVLRAWDVGALLPVLDSLGFSITDEGQRHWQDWRYSDTLSLVVARTPALAEIVKSCLHSLSFLVPHEDSAKVLSFPSRTITQ